MTEIIKSILDAYYQSMTQADPVNACINSGFIGCGEAESDLSIRYKAQLAESLKDKYGKR
ncbi:hypothetical protein [Acaryochloris thomasi]|uniref:hypothetical protein n=1 Tax=Acaryochloris thomasi TaxID=2929456 RepID=UPI000DA65831|nr:hypothetical protein [Acaryochloris thomasi]